EHWPSAFSTLMAGGGINGGQVYGATDRTGAYPSENPVTPGDFMATICHCLGVDPHSKIHDQFDRPLALFKGNPITPLLASHNPTFPSAPSVLRSLRCVLFKPPLPR